MHEDFLPSVLVNDANKVFFVSFKNVNSAHLADFLPVIEKNVERVSVVNVFEDHNTFAEFCSEISGIHSAAHDILGWVKSV